MATSVDRTIVGFDLGHGESAVASVSAGSNDPPGVLDLRSPTGRQHVTAVAEHPEFGVLVGEAALDTAGCKKPIYLGFKSRHLERDEVCRPIALFVKKIRQDLDESAAIRRSKDALWVFGAPSGWSDDVRAIYAKVLRSTGIANVDVVKESRAAMLYARDAKDVTVERSALSGSVLVVDVGSSTTDFTAVVGLRARESGLGTELGASLIDRTIQRRVLAAHPERDLLETVLGDDSDERLRMELQCRKAKEKFFRLDPTLTAKASRQGDALYVLRRTGAPTVWVPIEVSADDMAAVLATPQPALGGRTWPEAFVDDMAAAARELLDGTPDAVLLTGGASRMHFVRESARALFASGGRNASVLLGAEPEVAIARGLAIAGRISTRTGGFRADVTGFLAGDIVPAVVRSRIPGLVEKIGNAATDGITERHVIPAFRRWRTGEIRTLNGVAESVAKAVSAELTDPNNPVMIAVMAEWQSGLRTELAELTRPLCQRWHLEPSAMALPAATLGNGKYVVSMDNSDAVTGMLNAMAMAINVVVATVISAVLLGHGIALIATTGPLAPILLAVGLIVAGVYGQDALKEKALIADLPMIVRKAVPESMLTKKVRADAAAKEGALAAELAQQLTADGGKQIVTQVSALIVIELEELAKEAELLIA